jgi:hypothetical protein
VSVKARVPCWKLCQRFWELTDRRATFANGRVADVALKGVVEADRFVQPDTLTVITPVADIRSAPDAPRLERQAVFGTNVDVLEIEGATVFGRETLGGYVGYFDNAALGVQVDPTHRVCVRTTLGFSGPDIKTPNPIKLPFGARVRVVGQKGMFLQTDDNWFFPAKHLSPLDVVASDPVTVADIFLGAPYLWGGNSAFGLDCSGLVQASLFACGESCPGDSDQQRILGMEISLDQVARGDLLFWKGHVAWVVSPDQILHSNGSDMAVAYEPLQSAITRIEQDESSPFIGARRLG